VVSLVNKEELEPLVYLDLLEELVQLEEMVDLDVLEEQVLLEGQGHLDLRVLLAGLGVLDGQDVKVQLVLVVQSAEMVHLDELVLLELLDYLEGLEQLVQEDSKDHPVLRVV